MTLSIIIPVFNEEKTIKQLLRQLQSLNIADINTEVIIVDDGSTDATGDIVSKNSQLLKKLKYICHKQNLGKGAAVRTGIIASRGDYILIQDADLEYNPQDIPKLLTPILEGKAQVVYGTRLNRLPDFRKDERTVLFFTHYMGNKFLSLVTSILYGQWITDMETGYKIIPGKLIKELQLVSRGFELEPEITAKLLKRGITIFEVSISTNPRGYDQGKKLNTVTDGIKALSTLIRYRFIN